MPELKSMTNVSEIKTKDLYPVLECKKFYFVNTFDLRIEIYMTDEITFDGEYFYRKDGKDFDFFSRRITQFELYATPKAAQEYFEQYLLFSLEYHQKEIISHQKNISGINEILENLGKEKQNNDSK